jgi:hypothetical protein
MERREGGERRWREKMEREDRGRWMHARRAIVMHV